MQNVNWEKMQTMNNVKCNHNSNHTYVHTHCGASSSPQGSWQEVTSCGCSTATWTSVWPLLLRRKERTSAGEGNRTRTRIVSEQSKHLVDVIACDWMRLSAAGWLTTKEVLCAVRPVPCGGWSLSESGDWLSYSRGTCRPLSVNLMPSSQIQTGSCFHSREAW